MSRRRGEFEHRTSIFEGAFRAWSHLGGLEPEDLETKPASELDPLNAPILNDHRLLQGKKGKDDSGTPTLNPDGSKRREYPYEPLPRSGLAHPYVQAILSPWLGPDADNDAIQLGLTTLRTWWQHRRKGESGSAIAALGTEKMKGVVEGYTRHFFTLAHCLIMNDKEQPPRSLHSKMKEAEKMKNKKNKKRGQDEDPAKLALFGGLGAASNNPAAVSAGIAADLTNQNLSPLERLHVAQQRQLAVEGGVSNNMAGGQVQTINPLDPSNPIIPIKNKCVPGKPDLPAIVDAVNHHAAQLTHSGSSKIMDKSGSAGATPAAVPSTGLSIPRNDDSDAVPVVFVTGRGEVLLSMAVDGITCAHCVKIVETVLKGCNGNKSPIDGLLDAAADRALCSILIKIDRVSNAKRIAFEASRNLAMVGYSAKAKDMSPTAERNGKSEKLTAEQMAIAFEQVGRAHPLNIFNWTSPCSCPDNGVLREDCARHSQMCTTIFEAFDTRRQMTQQYLCGAKLDSPPQIQPQTFHNNTVNDPFATNHGMNDNNMHPLNAGFGHVNGGMNQHGGNGNVARGGIQAVNLSNMNEEELAGNSRNQRNMSVISFGGAGLRGMSFTSERASFGRAMSGLSALSIDWENMEDFDVNVDHSAHINNGNPNSQSPNNRLPESVNGGPTGGNPSTRRSSLRRSFVANNNEDAHVSFKV